MGRQKRGRVKRHPSRAPFSLLVSPSLKFKQVGVLPVHSEQAFMIPSLQDFTFVDDNDLVGRPDS